MANSRGIAITYGDVAPEAKENFSVSASETKYATLTNLQKYNVKLENYASPCEQYQTLLDGSAVAIPYYVRDLKCGLWSKQLSGDDGVFAEPITVTLESDGQYSAQGFTFTFDKFNDIYPTRLTIQWLRVTNEGIEDLSGVMEFNPTSSFFFCRNKVENFNKAIIKFYALNMPKNRLRLDVIDYGYGTVFYGEELRNVKISQSIDPITTEIKINTCDFTLDSKTDMEYSFQAKQPLSVAFNGKLLATVFVKSSKRNGKFLWDINAEDYISLMENVPYVGGIYTDANAVDILTDIFTVAKTPYTIADELSDVTLTGYIPYTTCREALMQVCFACMAAVNTSNSDCVEVKMLDDDIKQTIPLSRIMQGQSFEESDTVTKVELTAHTYEKSEEAMNAYNASESGTGSSILVKFSEPLHSLGIKKGEILKSGANYAVINADEGCIFGGYKYTHGQQVRSLSNPKVLAGEKENVSSITSATLISPKNVDKVLESCYNHLTKTSSVNLKIVVGKDVERKTRTAKWGEEAWGSFKWKEFIVNETITDQQDVNLGECITTETEYLGDISGRLISQSFNLNSNIIVKEAVLK